MIPADYHLHTRLCGHATGVPGQYLEEAGRKGIREIGFSDHLPLYFLPPGKSIPDYAMKEEELPLYVEMVKNCAQQSPVRVKLGIEADFVPGYENKLASLLSAYPFDYVLGSVHFIDGWGFDNLAEAGEYLSRGIDQVYEEYFHLLQQAALTGLFDVMAHPDLVKKFNYRPVMDLKHLYEETARVFKRAQVCVEVNTAGLRYPAQEMYPSAGLLEIFFKHGLPVTLGSDAHCPGHVGEGLEQAVSFLRSTGYTEITLFEKRKRTIVKL